MHRNFGCAVEKKSEKEIYSLAKFLGGICHVAKGEMPNLDITISSMDSLGLFSLFAFKSFNALLTSTTIRFLSSQLNILC